MAESGKLNLDGGQAKDEERGTYKAVPESDTAQEIEYIEADGSYVQLNASEVMEAEATDEADDHWEFKAIRLMLNLYLGNLHKFRDPKLKKKDVWNEISQAIGKYPESCDKKFRNLKQTYIRLLKKKNRNEITTVKWPYFEIFEEIFSENGEYHPEIQQKIQENPTETVTKALMSMNASARLEASVDESEEKSQGRSDDIRKRITKKRHLEFKKFTSEMRVRQRTVEEKLDKLISIVKESNNIQRTRNALFQQFLDKLNSNQ